MSTSNNLASTVLNVATDPERLHGHIGDPPHDVFYYIVYSKLLANGELPAAVAFIMATPIFAGKAGHAGGTDLLAGSGLDWTGVLRQQDINFQQKFSKPRRNQGRGEGLNVMWLTC